MKPLFYVFLVLICLTTKVAGQPKNTTAYFAFNPKIKIGKELGSSLKNERNNFLEFNIFRAKYRQDQFGISGGATVGFTGTGTSLSANHFYKRLSLKSSWFFSNQLSFFGEATFASLIDGSNNPVQYFMPGNYQAIGLERDIKIVHKNGAVWNNESKVKIGKYDNANFFSEVVISKINHRVNPFFSWSLGLSTGITAPRKNFFEWHWYMSRLTGRLTIRPTGSVGLFLEGNIATIHDNTVKSPYFAQVPYIAVGMAMDGFKFFK